MILDDLSGAEIAARLRRSDLVIETGPLVVRLGTSLPELGRSVRLLYGDFPVVESERIVDFEIRVDPTSAWRRHLFARAAAFIDGQRTFLPFPRRMALPMFEWSFNWCVFSRPNRFLLLHAGVLERGGRVLLLSGRPGAGKSTLAAALAFRGFRLFSDEVALIPPGSGSVLPVPRPVGLKERSIDVIRSFEPDAVIGPSCEGTRKGTVAHLRPPREALSRAREPGDARWIVFPEFSEGAGAALEPVPKAEAFVRVGKEAFNYSLLGRDGFDALAVVVDRCDCYRLRFGSLDEAIDLLDRLTAATPAAAAARPE